MATVLALLIGPSLSSVGCGAPAGSNLNERAPSFSIVDVDGSTFLWEAFGSRIGNGQVYLNNDYQHFVAGADVGFEFDGGAGLVRANVARYTEDSANSTPPRTGCTAGRFTSADKATSSVTAR